MTQLNSNKLFFSLELSICGYDLPRILSRFIHYDAVYTATAKADDVLA